MRVALQPRRHPVRRSEQGKGRAPMEQAGETLIEVMISVLLMSVAFSAILTGMIGSARIASKNQELTRANVVLSAAADRLLEPTGAFKYRPCGAANNGVAATNNGDTQWQLPWASYQGYTPQAESALLPAGWRVRIKDVRYLLGPDYFNRAPNASFGPNADNVLVPQWSAWGKDGFYRCADLKSMNPATPTMQRDGGLQQIRLVVEKPDGSDPNSYKEIDQIVVTKRDQRCPPDNYANADRGPC